MDVVLLIVSIVIGIIVLVCSVYFVAYFQHQDDELTAWAPKVFVILGISLASYNILLVPLDVANVNNGNLPIYALSLISLISTLAIGFAIIPFMMFYYEGYSGSETRKNKTLHQLLYAAKWTVPFLFVLVAAAIPLYLFAGNTSHRRTTLNAKFVQGNISLFGNFCDATAGARLDCSRTFNIVEGKMNPFVFAIAVANLIGWIMLAIFVPVGAVSIFLDSWREFRIRNSVLTKRDYQKEQERILSHSQRLLREHENIKKLENGSKNEQKEAKKSKKTFIKQVIQLENEYDILLDRSRERDHFKKSKVNKFFLITVGILVFSLYLLWCIQIILYSLPIAIGLNPVFAFLNYPLKITSKLPLLSTIIYGIMSLSIIFMSIKGLQKMSSTLSIFSIYPIVMGESTMNSLLFNTGIILFISISTLHLSILSFATYTSNSVLSAVFLDQIQNINHLKYFYVSVLAAFLVLSPVIIIGYVVSSCFRTRKRKLKNDKQNQSREMAEGESSREEKSVFDKTQNQTQDPLDNYFALTNFTSSSQNRAEGNFQSDNSRNYYKNGDPQNSQFFNDFHSSSNVFSNSIQHQSNRNHNFQPDPINLHNLRHPLQKNTQYNF